MKRTNRLLHVLCLCWLALALVAGPLLAQPAKAQPGAGMKPGAAGAGSGSEKPEGPPIDVLKERAKPQGIEAAGPALTQKPQRLCPLFPQSVAMMPLFRLQKQVVGMPLGKLNASFHAGGFFNQAFPEAEQCPDVGFPGKANLEVIVGLKPDLVMLPYFHGQGAERVMELMQMPRFRMFGSFANVAQWLEAVTRFGAVVGKPEVASAYCGYVQKKIAFVKDRLAKAPQPTRPPRVLRVIKSGKRYLCFGARLELGNDIMRICGIDAYGADVKQGGDGVFSIEEALAFDPDYIFVDGSSHVRSPFATELNEPFWKQLRAFREGRVFRVPMDDPTCFVTGWYFNIPVALGLLWTAKTIYPEQFKDVDLDAEADQFYRKFFSVNRRRMLDANSALKPMTPRH